MLVISQSPHTQRLEPVKKIICPCNSGQKEVVRKKLRIRLDTDAHNALIFFFMTGSNGRDLFTQTFCVNPSSVRSDQPTRFLALYTLYTLFVISLTCLPFQFKFTSTPVLVIQKIKSRMLNSDWQLYLSSILGRITYNYEEVKQFSQFDSSS